MKYFAILGGVVFVGLLAAFVFTNKADNNRMTDYTSSGISSPAPSPSPAAPAANASAQVDSLFSEIDSASEAEQSAALESEADASAYDEEASIINSFEGTYDESSL